MNKKLIIVLIVVVIALAGGWYLLKGKGSYSPTPTATQTTTQATTSPTPQIQGKLIEISGFKFAPATLTIKAGETVSVIDRDGAGHSLTSDDGTSFDTGVLAKDTPGTFTAPTKPGTYTFHCSTHPSMKGTLVVQ